MPQELVVYRLACTHLVLGPPNQTARPCPFDDWKESPTEDIVIKEWHAKCTSCSYGRWTALSQANAAQAKRNHESKRPTHIVGVHADIRPNSVKVRDHMRENHMFSEPVEE